MSVRELIGEEQCKYVAIVREKSKDYDDVIIYGAGIYGRDLNSFLKRNGVNVDGFCVTAKEFNGDTVQNLPVRELAEYRADGKKRLFLIAATEPINREMISALKNAGFTDYIDVPGYIDAITDEAFFRPTLEITTCAGCSVNCRYCPQDLFLKKYYAKTDKKMMSIDEFKVCIDKTPKDLIVDFSGFVEPFLNPKAADMILYAAQKQRDIRLYTTFVGLTLESLKKIENVPFMRVVVHIPDVKGYANIPLTDKYFSLLKYATNLKKSNGEPFIDKASSQSEPHPKAAEILRGKVAASWNLVDRAGNLSGDTLASGYTGKGEIYCVRAAELNHNILLPNGDIALCCMDYALRHTLGNLLNDSYEDIVHGVEAKAIKQSMTDSGESLCRHCTAARSLEAIQCQK